ncbi:unnamed protein product [Rotaria socialis]
MRVNTVIIWATKHFRQYLEVGSVIVRSDCKALEWLKNARDPTSRLARWSMKLSPYNIAIQHRPGTSNPNGDFMSRYPLQTNTTTAQELNSLESGINILEGTNLLDNIRSAQPKGARLLRIIQSLSSQLPGPFNATHSPYIVINILLYKIRHFNSYTDQRLLGSKYLIVISQTLETTILRWAHDHPTAGHAGRLQHYVVLHRRFTGSQCDKMYSNIFNPAYHANNSNTQTLLLQTLCSYTPYLNHGIL